jgi:hypothetical protein
LNIGTEADMTVVDIHSYLFLVYRLLQTLQQAGT